MLDRAPVVEDVGAHAQLGQFRHFMRLRRRADAAAADDVDADARRVEQVQGFLKRGPD